MRWPSQLLRGHQTHQLHSACVTTSRDESVTGPGRSDNSRARLTQRFMICAANALPLHCQASAPRRRRRPERTVCANVLIMRWFAERITSSATRTRELHLSAASSGAHECECVCVGGGGGGMTVQYAARRTIKAVWRLNKSAFACQNHHPHIDMSAATRGRRCLAGVRSAPNALFPHSPPGPGRLRMHSTPTNFGRVCASTRGADAFCIHYMPAYRQ